MARGAAAFVGVGRLGVHGEVVRGSEMGKSDQMLLLVRLNAVKICTKVALKVNIVKTLELIGDNNRFNKRPPLSFLHMHQIPQGSCLFLTFNAIVKYSAPRSQACGKATPICAGFYHISSETVHLVYLNQYSKLTEGHHDGSEVVVALYSYITNSILMPGRSLS